MSENTSLDQRLSTIQRQHAPRLLAVLVRIFGAHNLSLAEDVLQDAMLEALHHWQTGLPENPQAWLTRVAKNKALDRIKQAGTQAKYAQDLHLLLESNWTSSSVLEAQFDEQRIKDDQLRMLFMCCQAQISHENCLPLMLTALCGLSIKATASALLINQATVKKRLQRVKGTLRDYQFCIPREDQLSSALSSVHIALYLLFNEGFHNRTSSRDDHQMLCKEALALAQSLVVEQKLADQETYALIALMHFLLARIDAKYAQQGCNISIDQQNRSMWDKQLIAMGNNWLEKIPNFNHKRVGRFCFEALIAQQHCIAATFEQTDWATIFSLYQQLYTITQSPMTLLNLAVAQAYSGNVTGAISLVEKLQGARQLKDSYLPAATLAHLYAMRGDGKKAKKFVALAQQQGADDSERERIWQQIQRLLDSNNGQDES